MTNDERREAVQIARKFHDTYERLAPKFGYETREDTKAFDHKSPNGKLMIATIKEAMLSHDAIDLHHILAFEAGQADSAAELRERDSR